MRCMYLALIKFISFQTRTKNLLLLLLFSPLVAVYGQSTNITDISGDAASIKGGQTNIPIFGFTLDKSAGSPSVTGMTIHFSSSPTGIFLVPSLTLVESGDNIYGNGDDTSRGSLTLVSGTDYSCAAFGAVTIPNSPGSLNYYVVANIDPTITTAASIIVSVSALAGGSSIATNSAGATFDNTNITKLNASPSPNNGALPGAMAGSNTNNPILGFSVTSNGTQSVNNVVITLTTTASSLATVLTSITLKDDGGNSTYSGGGNSYAGGAAVQSGTGPYTYTIAFIPSSPLSASAKYFYVVANVPATAPTTTGIQVDLINVGVTQGYVSTLSGYSRSFNIGALTATASANNGALSGTLAGSNSNVPILGFSATSNGSQSINNVVITLTTSASSLATILTSISLKDDGSNSSYSGGGTSYAGGAPVQSGTGPYTYTITFTPASPLSASAKYFYVVANVPAAAPTTPGIQADLTTVAVTKGTPPTLSRFSGSFDVNALNASLATNNGALSATLVAGNVNKPIFGFSATTNGTQSINNVVIAITTTAATLPTILTNIALKDDTGNSTYSTGGTAYAAGAPVQSGTGPFTYTITFTPTSTLSGVAKYFYVVADIPGAAPSTPGIQVDVTTVGVTQGSSSSLTGFTRTFSIAGLTATYTTISGAPVSASTSLVSGSATNVLAGLSVSSNGTQTITAINFGVTNPTSFAHFYLYRNSVAGVLGATILANSATSSSFTISDNVVAGTTKYYYLVADAGATSTGSSAVTLDET